MANLGDLSGFRSYAEWQAANRAAGGSGNSPEVAAYFNGGNAQAGPAGAAPPPAAQQPSNNIDAQAQWAHDNIDSTISLDAWKAYGPMDPGCPQDNPYRSSRKGGDNACVEKPDNCPDGKTLDGDTCITNEAANQKYGGGYGGVPEGAYRAGQAGGAGAAATAPAQDQDPLQAALVQMYQEHGGMFGGSPNGQDLSGGGIWWSGSGGALPMTPAAQTATVAQTAATQAATQPAPAQPAPQPQSGASALQSALTSATQSSKPDMGGIGGAGAKQDTSASPLTGALMGLTSADPNAWWKKAGTASLAI